MANPVTLSEQDVLGSLGSLCAIHRIPFDPQLVRGQLPPPYSLSGLVQAGRALGFKVSVQVVPCRAIPRLTLPCMALIQGPAPPSTGATAGEAPPVRCVLIVKADAERMLFIEPGAETAVLLPIADFEARFRGEVLQFVRAQRPVTDPEAQKPQPFGFRWFIPEICKHKRIWHDVLLASLALQLIGLATPLFTQVIIDKVVVHQSFTTLTVIGMALFVCLVFTAAMSWVRQYLVLHTGNRVDAVLGTQVFEHLIKLPLRYFEHRSTGVIVARLQGVETIREFVSSTATTLGDFRERLYHDSVKEPIRYPSG